MKQTLMEYAERLAESLGPWGYALLLLAALVEYIFPPFPGDSVVVLGGAWAWRSSQSWLGVWLAVTLGNALGISLQHHLGRTLARNAKEKAEGRVLKKLMRWGLTTARIEAVREQMHKRGVALLLVNRFLPSFRVLVFLAAGASGLPFKKTLAWGLLGSLAWSAFILGVGAWLGGNAERMLLLLERYQTAVAWAFGAALVLWVFYKWKKRAN